jgi:hypothetical protein
MQNMNNALRLGTFISQLEAGRNEQVAAMVVEATLPYGHLDDDWPGRGGREVGKLSRALAKAANPKRGLSEAQLLELLQDTFAQYTAIAGAATVQPEASVAFRSWRRTWRGRATLHSTSRSSSLSTALWKFVRGRGSLKAGIRADPRPVMHAVRVVICQSRTAGVRRRFLVLW